MEKQNDRLGRRRGEDEPLGSNTEIARKLKQYYEGLVVEEVPDRFADLLSQLEQAEKQATE